MYVSQARLTKPVQSHVYTPEAEKTGHLPICNTHLAAQLGKTERQPSASVSHTSDTASCTTMQSKKTLHGLPPCSRGLAHSIPERCVLA